LNEDDNLEESDDWDDEEFDDPEDQVSEPIFLTFVNCSKCKKILMGMAFEKNPLCDDCAK